ncbi:unnamed protein product [Effrenium voratum]|uniref:Fe2OG dioxygenase domain-containing protein n=1 Tax=Effrenium voratum TaxID=2562239 RepID=A0AA36JG42_9DINO|nr:unnamed protein product [Effrenium voratum]CAJ1428959.1 unnamed protein product [Effrenium voratum]
MASKGERLLLGAGQMPARPLPPELRRQEVLRFETARFDLRRAVAEMLRAAPDLGHFDDDGSLERFAGRSELFRSFPARQNLHRRVAASDELLGIYEDLVRQELVPWLQQRLNALGDADPRSFFYQYPPTLRIQPPSGEFKRPHRDAEYGHQIGELNFWMPLTDYSLTQTSLWVESSPDAGDFQALAIDYGEIAMFHGTLCQHKVPANTSPYTRVSMDFRIGVGGYFDPSWQLPGIKKVHLRREVRADQ